MREILCVVLLIAKVVAAILFVWEAAGSLKAKASGNYLEAIYCLGWATIALVSAMNL